MCHLSFSKFLKKNSKIYYILCIIGFLLAGLLFLCGCLFKQGFRQNFSVREVDVPPVFIELSQNSQVYENISPIVYNVIVEHFELVGYKISNGHANAYSLRVLIKNLEPIQKFVSPDILLFNSVVRLDLECQLLSFDKSLLASNKFYFCNLMSKPKNPVISSDFLDFEYKRLLRIAAPKIEQYFRPYFLGKGQ